MIGPGIDDTCIRPAERPLWVVCRLCGGAASAKLKRPLPAGGRLKRFHSPTAAIEKPWCSAAECRSTANSCRSRCRRPWQIPHDEKSATGIYGTLYGLNFYRPTCHRPSRAPATPGERRKAASRRDSATRRSASTTRVDSRVRRSCTSCEKRGWSSPPSRWRLDRESRGSGGTGRRANKFMMMRLSKNPKSSHSLATNARER